MMPQYLVKPPDHLKKIHVLVVDNDQKILNIMANVLKHLGFSHVHQARDGFTAVQIMRKEDIDLIITDWELHPLSKNYSGDLPQNPIIHSEQWSPVPPRDGECFVKYVRNSKYSPNPFVSVIMLTGIGLRNHIEYARDAGVNEILLKPLSMEDLCRRIVSLIDFPRPFVVSKYYKGPCRRTETAPRRVSRERRKCDLKVYRYAG